MRKQTAGLLFVMNLTVLNPARHAKLKGINAGRGGSSFIGLGIYTGTPGVYIR